MSLELLDSTIGIAFVHVRSATNEFLRDKVILKSLKFNVEGVSILLSEWAVHGGIPGWAICGIGAGLGQESMSFDRASDGM